MIRPWRTIKKFYSLPVLYSTSVLGWCLDFRLRAPCSQPDADTQVETRKTRITRADFRGVFPILSRGPAVHVGVGLQGSRWARGSSSGFSWTYRLDKFSQTDYLRMFHFRP